MKQEATVKTTSVDSASIRCGDYSWEYSKYMHKLTPDFELSFLNIDVVTRDEKPVELQISVARAWRESMYKGKRDTARIYIRTAEEAVVKGKEDAKVWARDFDPLGSSAVGPNSKHNPIVVDSIEIQTKVDDGGSAGPSGEASPPGLYDGVLDPAFLPDRKPLVYTDDMQTMMNEMLKLCRTNGFYPRDAELMFLRLAMISRNAQWKRYDPSEDL